MTVSASPPSFGKSVSPAEAGLAVIGCSIVAIDDLIGRRRSVSLGR
jgi:hypothetical protein